jgi:hypothetical protein
MGGCKRCGKNIAVLELEAFSTGTAAAAAAAHLIEGAAGRVEELWGPLLALAGQQLLQLALVIDPCMATSKHGLEVLVTSLEAVELLMWVSGCAFVK